MKKVVRWVISFIPTPLPSGLTEYSSWADDILSLSKVPDNDSTRFTIAVMILHLNSTEDRKPKRFFVKSLNKAAANEIANSIATGLKEKQRTAAAEEQARKMQSSIESNRNGVSNDELEQNKGL